MSEVDLEAVRPPQYNQVESPSAEKDVLKIQANGQEEDYGCSIPMMIMLALPRMAISMAWAAQWAAVGPYLSTMLPNSAVQLTQVIGPLSGILVAPTVGVLSDRSTNRYGRRRPILLFGAVTSAICWTLMGFTRDLGEVLGDKDGDNKWTAIICVFFYMWMDITVNIVQTPAFLIIADHAGSRQTTGAAIGQATSTLGNLLVASYIQIFGPAHKSSHTFLAMLAIVMLVTVGIVCFFATEKPLEQDPHSTTSNTLQQVGQAFRSIITGVRTLPQQLAVFCVIFFCVCYGFTAYSGNKGQFFGLNVYGGSATDADKCGGHCTKAQNDYNNGVRLAGGITDIVFHTVGYIFSWTIPFFVRQIGAKWTITLSLIPQCLLMLMAFTMVAEIDVILVVLTCITQNVIFAMIVPVIIHEFGDQQEIGMYVGATNSANCLGQLLNFIIGAAITNTSMGYKLPVLVGGIVSTVGFFISVVFYKINLYSL